MKNAWIRMSPRTAVLDEMRIGNALGAVERLGVFHGATPDTAAAIHVLAIDKV